jgi:adenylate cyclase
LAELRARILADVEDESTRWEAAIYRTLAPLMGVVVLVVAMLWNKLGARLAVLELAVTLVAAIYFTICWRLLRKGNRPFAPALRLGSATLETSLASLALGLIAWHRSGEWAQTGPAVFIYMAAIMVTSARMRPRLCAYATVLASVQYLLLYYLVLLPRTSPEMLARLPPMQPWAAWNRVFWIALTGGIATFATHKARALMLSVGTGAAQQRWLEGEFGRYVSRDVANAVMRGSRDAERRQVSVLFCDLRDFTAVCERVAPEAVVSMLNTFYGKVCEIIEAHGGTVNKFMGDAVLALFGAPQTHPRHAAAAADAARAILAAADELRGQGGMWEGFDVGIGLDTGDVVAGEIGSASRVEYTAIGSTVNRAARLQGLARRAGQRIIVSGACARALGERGDLVSLGDVTLKGFSAPEPAYAFA